MAGASQPPWRWEWLTSPEASDVPLWLRIGPGPEGAPHGIVVALVRIREGVLRDPDGGYRPLDAIVEDTGDQWGSSRADVAAHLRRLEAEGVVEPDLEPRADGERWRATPLAIEAIEAAYALRDPFDVLRRDPH